MLSLDAAARVSNAKDMGIAEFTEKREKGLRE
jgi:hypothetical protein